MSPVLEIWACDLCNPDGCDGPSENEDAARRAVRVSPETHE